MKKGKKRKGRAERRAEQRKDAILFAVVVFLLIVPLAAYSLCVYVFFPPAGHMAFSIVGLAGTLLSGIAMGYLANEMLCRRKIGGCKCLYVLAAGLLIIAVSLICLYVPVVSGLFYGNDVAASVTLWIFYAFDMICYVLFFRIPMGKWLRREKGSIGYALRDWRNLLWYSDAHKEREIDLIYPIHKLFTIVFFFALALHLFLGWLHDMLLPVCILAGLSGITEAFLMYRVCKTLLSERNSTGFGLFQGRNADFEIWSGYAALVLWLLASAIISFGLPILIYG